MPLPLDTSKVEELFNAAVLKQPGPERAAFLNGACGGDTALRARVEALLASHEAADGGSFLSPAGPPLTAPASDDVPAAAAATADGLLERPGTRIGRYRLLQLIGEGGFGSVYMAEQEHPVRRRVALKIIKPGMDTRQVIARFEAERQALALMDHPNIARVLDAGETPAGRPFFVMELVNGVPITQYCDTNNLPTRQRLELFESVCHAVQHAHQKGIIHRDIKPSNVLITLHDGRPVPKVIDFGIAKATQGKLTDRTLFTEFRHMIGTPEYMSPEQAEMSGLDVDTRCDVYSLGVLLYELLTGTTPLDARELRKKAYAELQRMIREVEPPKPSTRVESLGATLATVAARRGTEPRKLGQLMRGELDWIVMKAMEKDRTRRYETANGLAMDVRRHLDNEPIVARPATAGYRLRKLARKHRVGLAATAAVMMSLLLGLIGTTSGLLRARAARDQAVNLQHAAEKARDDLNDAARFIRALATRDQYDTDRNRETIRRLDAGWLKDQPDAAASCRLLISQKLFNAAKYEEAEQQILALLVLFRENDGRYRGGAWAPLLNMATLRHQAKDHAGAEKWLREALDAMGRSTEPTPDDYENALLALTDTLELQDRVAEAAEVRTRALRMGIKALSRHIEHFPNDLGLYEKRTGNYLLLGDARGALADWSKRVELFPDSSELAYAKCLMALYVGEQETYRNACRDMLRRFSDTNAPEDAERTAKAHLASPDPDVPVERLAALVDRALERGSPELRPFFQMTKAMADYRSGRFESAIEGCRQSRGIGRESAQATLDALTAMCHQRIGNHEQAARWLKQAEGRPVSLVEGEHFALAQLLVKEAKGLLGGSEATTRPAGPSARTPS